MRDRAAILFFILVGFCLTFISCASKPLTELREARDTIRAAKTAGAERYAPGPLTEAQSSFDEAEEGAATRDELRELYVRAAIQAKIAEAQAHMKEAEETLRQLQGDHTSAKEAAAAAKSSAEQAEHELGQQVP